MRLLTYFIFLVLLGCGNQKKVSESVTASADTIPSRAEETSESKSEGGTEKERFVFINDTISQELVVDQYENDSIRFSIQVRNLSRNLSSEIHGKAVKNKSTEGAELDENREGDTYLVDEYFFDKDCWLAIRIDADNHLTARIKEAECSRKHPTCCPFRSIGIMERSIK
jgi:hypothetical protein